MGIHVKRAGWVTGGIVMAVLLAAVPARAQELRATMPFAFSVGKTMLPAGSYTIDEASDPELLALRAADGKAAAFVATIADRPTDMPATPELVFVRVGGTYRLESIVMGDDLVREVPASAETPASIDRVAIRLQRARPTRAE